ncbi:hypothetical protein EJ110_NYTH53389 [Nymphaea thermarum]|nr:hypothetical protein EJ110_NYTH53389 [Nymphaea thermarum]
MPNSRIEAESNCVIGPSDTTNNGQPVLREREVAQGLLSSDQALTNSEDTAKMVLANINSGSTWLHKFAGVDGEDRGAELRSGDVRYLRTKCPDPESSTQDATVALDPVTPNRLDNKYYVNLKYQRGLLTSDQALTERADTARMGDQNVNQGSVWAHKFSAAMVRMGSIEVLTASRGEIRKSCRVVN